MEEELCSNKLSGTFVITLTGQEGGAIDTTEDGDLGEDSEVDEELGAANDGNEIAAVVVELTDIVHQIKLHFDANTVRQAKYLDKSENMWKGLNKSEKKGSVMVGF